MCEVIEAVRIMSVLTAHIKAFINSATKPLAVECLLAPGGQGSVADSKLRCVSELAHYMVNWRPLGVRTER